MRTKVGRGWTTQVVLGDSVLIWASALNPEGSGCAFEYTESKQKEFLKGLLSKIVVKSEFGYGRDKTKEIQRGHSLEFHYKMKIVDDGFEWTDKTRTPWSGKVTEGRRVDKSDVQRFVSSRKKKV